ncbi:quaternary amine ABC transporter ATP-binding protein [Urinicoccus timonensis]|uniref:quaternary amine ABC transporter ATP-binding protein n=1 Tax=Urinicoccus timonensis TaxID=2024205 RepID=UPI000C07E764|nr:glycine betaine/L-proline ABC transporter ATP-binding protein [Urinicoccus timonensis]
MTKIKVEKLTKIFGKNPKKAYQLLEKGQDKKEIFKETGMTVGVNQVSFEVQEGEMFVIMGLSGSGKSTLIRLINRLIEPTAGDIFIDGENISHMEPEALRETRRKKLSMVFQSFALFPHRTILENTAYGLEIQNVDEETGFQKAKEALELVNLGGYEDQYPDQLSGGMQQRVGLARALAADTDIILMDEAFSALDPLIRKGMQDELEKIQRKMKKTILFITHDLNEALKLGDRIALMRDGKIVQIGSPEEILMDPANTFVERFVEDVDISKVLTAKNVMIEAETVDSSRHGPRVAMEIMRKAEISSLYVVDSQDRLQGIVTADDVMAAIRQGKNSLDEILIKDVPQVDGEMPLTDIIDMVYDTKIPIAVVRDGELEGIIIRGTVLAALAGNEVDHE